MTPNHSSLQLAKEYKTCGPGFASIVGAETSYASDYKWKMNTDFLKSSVARRLPNGHNPHPRDARFITWIHDKVCNMSTYDRPLTGYTRPHPRSRKELITTTSLTYRAPPPESYRARTAASTDRAALLSSTGVKCALSTWSQPARPYSTDLNYKVKTGKMIDLEVDRQKKEKLLKRAAREVYKPKVDAKTMTKNEVIQLKQAKLERERNLEQTRYRKEIRRQMEKSRQYDFSLIPFVHRNTEYSHPQERVMINKRIQSACPGLVR